MRRYLLAPALLVLLLPAACMVQDPDPEERRVGTNIRVDGEKSRMIRSEERYEDFDWWTDDVDGLPGGFTYRTRDLGLDGDGYLRVEYEIRVGPNVKPRRYRFEAKYVLYHTSDIQDEVQFEFVVWVHPRNSRSLNVTLGHRIPPGVRYVPVEIHTGS